MALAFASKRQVGSKTRLLWETPCKLIEDERSLVVAISSGKCVVDELLYLSKACQSKSSSSRHICVLLCDQAANLSEVLAWSFILKSVLRTANIIDVYRTPILFICVSFVIFLYNSCYFMKKSVHLRFKILVIVSNSVDLWKKYYYF